jgi:hypothetical protein
MAFPFDRIGDCRAWAAIENGRDLHWLGDIVIDRQ